MWESLEDDGPVSLEVEDGEALHLLGDTAGLGDLQAGLPGQDGEHGGVVSGALGLGEGELEDLKTYLKDISSAQRILILL